MGTLEKKSLFNAEAYQQSLERINRLTAESRPLWGSMSSGQMLAHCAEIQEVANGKTLGSTPLMARIFKGMIRNMVLNDKPYPKNLKTHPQYKQTSASDFAAEKQRLLNALETYVNANSANPAPSRHPFLGEMNVEEKGWSMYKHLDHHLKQFGV